MNKLAVIITVFLVACNSVFCQYEGISLFNSLVGTDSYTPNGISFVSADTGYFMYSVYNNEAPARYFQTADSGRNWQLVDSTEYTFNVRSIRFANERGVVFGNMNNESVIEMFNSDLSEKTFYTLPQLNQIYDMSIVDQDTIIFSGQDSDLNNCLGKIIITDGIPHIATVTTFTTPDYATKIEFFDSNRGWYKTGNDIIYTNDLGLTEQLRLNNIELFNFYDSQNGVVYSRADNQVRFTSDGGYSWPKEFSIEGIWETNGIIMTSENFAHLSHSWTGINGYAVYIIINSDTGILASIQTTSEFACSPDFQIGTHFNNQVYWLSCVCDNLLFSLNNGGFSEYELENTPNAELQIFTSPDNDVISISCPEFIKQKTISYQISSTLGQFITNSTLNCNGNCYIDISDLKPGIYIIRLNFDNSTISKKFIKL